MKNLMRRKVRREQRRGLHQPEGLAFQAHGRIGEAGRHGRQHEERQRHVQKGEQVLQVDGLDGRPFQRQRREVVDVDDHQGGDQKELRPLGLVAEEGLDLLHREGPDRPGKKPEQALADPVAADQADGGGLGAGEALEVQGVGGEGQNADQGDGKAGAERRVEEAVRA